MNMGIIPDWAGKRDLHQNESNSICYSKGPKALQYHVTMGLLKAHALDREKDPTVITTSQLKRADQCSAAAQNPWGELIRIPVINWSPLSPYTSP